MEEGSEGRKEGGSKVTGKPQVTVTGKQILPFFMGKGTQNM